VRTAPAPRLASETNNDCQVKFELLQIKALLVLLPPGAPAGDVRAILLGGEQAFF